MILLKFLRLAHNTSGPEFSMRMCMYQRFRKPTRILENIVIRPKKDFFDNTLDPWRVQNGQVEPKKYHLS